MAEAGAATTLYQNSYGTDAFSTILNTTYPKFLKSRMVDLVYGTDPKVKAISPALALMRSSAMENVSSLGQKFVWTFKTELPTGEFASYRETFIPEYFDNWTSQAEMPVGLVRIDVMLDRAMFEGFNAGSERAINAYIEYMERHTTAAQTMLARSIMGDGVQYWDYDAGALASFEKSASGLPIYGFGFYTESASRTNAILASANTYAGLDRSNDTYKKHRAKVFNAQGTTEGSGFPAGSSPGVFTTVNALTVAHLLYVQKKSRVGNAMPNTAFLADEEFLQLMSLGESKTIISSGGVNPELAKLGIPNIQVSGLTICHDPLFSRRGQIVFTNTDLTKLVMKKEPSLSQVQWLYNTGVNQYYQQIVIEGQMISYLPGCNAVLSNYGI